MTEVSQEPATTEPNGSAPQDMTSNAAEQGGDANNSNAPKPESAQKGAPAAIAEGNSSRSPKKRRKVNHACIYCRRSHMTCDLNRPCTRCIKRNIGHLCHDEPREPTTKKSKTESDIKLGEDDSPTKQDSNTSESSLDQRTSHQETGLNRAPPPITQNRVANTTAIAQPTPVSAPLLSSLAGNNQSFMNYDGWNPGSDSHFQDMHAFHPSYMFNTSEVSNEYNLLNDFLTNSLMDDPTLYAGDDINNLFSDPSLTNTMGTLSGNNALFATNTQNNQLLPPSQAALGNAISRPASGIPDKMREKYYLTAADPAGTDSAEERMERLLKAKYDAGMLKPFNYVKGYARLNQYMEKNLQPGSRMKILRELDKFRPKFRERMQRLTDIELVRVEMWFERCLMDYDRVFASMAIPACCWRRTGEIFRGNQEMAELIHVPIENLRDGKIAIHEIIVEDSLVNYWDKFGHIAFDKSQKAILTSCYLKNPDPKSKDPQIKCCFSFTIKRDPYDIPSVIVGNFLPVKMREP